MVVFFGKHDEIQPEVILWLHGISGRNWTSLPRCCFSHGRIWNRSMWKSRAWGGTLLRPICWHTSVMPQLRTPTWKNEKRKGWSSVWQHMTRLWQKKKSTSSHKPGSSASSFAERGIRRSRLQDGRDTHWSQCWSNRFKHVMQLACWDHTFTAEGVWIPCGSPGAEEPIGDVLLHCHIGGLCQSFHRVLHAASPLQTEDEVTARCSGHQSIGPLCPWH